MPKLLSPAQAASNATLEQSDLFGDLLISVRRTFPLPLAITPHSWRCLSHVLTGLMRVVCAAQVVVSFLPEGQGVTADKAADIAAALRNADSDRVHKRRGDDAGPTPATEAP